MDSQWYKSSTDFTRKSNSSVVESGNGRCDVIKHLAQLIIDKMIGIYKTGSSAVIADVFKHNFSPG